MAHWNHGSLKSSKSSIGAESFWNTLIMAHWNHRFQDFSQNRKHWNHRGQNNTFTGSFDGLMYTNTVFQDDSASNFAKFRLEYHNSQRFLEIRTHNSVFRHECRQIHAPTLLHIFSLRIYCVHCIGVYHWIQLISVTNGIPIHLAWKNLKKHATKSRGENFR